MTPLKAFRVFVTSDWGFENDIRYFRSPIEAEKDFWNRMREGMTSKDMPTAEDIWDEESKPWSVKFDIPMDEKCKAEGVVRFWRQSNIEYNEWDIDFYKVRIEEINIA